MTVRPADYFAASGMYVFDSASRNAWQALLANFGQALRSHGHGVGPFSEQPLEVRFDSDDATYRSTSMLIAHTCGYPLMTRWLRSHWPVSVPVFDIPGCEGKNYSSWFVCQQSDSRQSLAAFENCRVAINDQGSNSGMNVLRHAVSMLRTADFGNAAFFDSVIVSGSHEASLQLVAEGKAELAAIDAVSLYHLLRVDPELKKKSRVFAQSALTPGLPFIMRRDTITNLCSVDSIPAVSGIATGALNLCLEELDPALQDVLKLRRFEAVSADDYLPIMALEQAAETRGYRKIT